jgi:olfactory receptor
MAEENYFTVTEFVLVGLSANSKLQLSFLFLFLGIYLFTVVGNLGMITPILLSSHLHTPMNFSLASLSFINFHHSTIITPKIVSFVKKKNIVSYLNA